MYKELDHMLDRFPHHRTRIIELYDNNEDFRSLCNDYLQCSLTLLKLKKEVRYDIRMENQYRVLNLDLEREVVHYLTKSEKI